MMKICTLLKEKNDNAFDSKPVTVAFLGDSVTNGCFEVLPALNAENKEEGFDVVFEPGEAYAEKFRKILHRLYPKAQINIVNAGISGDSAPGGLARMDRDLLPFKPDMTVVCYGLNDSGRGEEGLADYREALEKIIRKLKEAGSEVVLMTPQPIATRVHTQLKGEMLRNMAAGLAESFEKGVFDRYMQAARQAAEKEGAVLCDVYARWMAMYRGGVDITDLMANYLNHPIREAHWLFALSLAETVFGV